MIETDSLVEAYIALRTEREEIKRKYEAQDQHLKEEMSQISTALLAACNEVGADSLRTRHGTVTRKLTERAYCGDWDNFNRFVLEKGLVDLYEKRIHQGNFRNYMAEHGGEGLPPGVNLSREYEIAVRRATSKSE